DDKSLISCHDFLPPKLGFRDMTDDSISFRSASFRRVPLCHFGKEALFLKFLEQTQIDKLLGLGTLRLRHLRRQLIQEELESLQCRIRFLRSRFYVDLVRLFEHLGIIGPHIFRIDLLSRLFVLEGEMNALDISFERGLDDIPIALEVSARGGETVSLDLHAQVREIDKLRKAHL